MCGSIGEWCISCLCLTWLCMSVICTVCSSLWGPGHRLQLYHMSSYPCIVAAHSNVCQLALHHYDVIQVHSYWGAWPITWQCCNWMLLHMPFLCQSSIARQEEWGSLVITWPPDRWLWLALYTVEGGVGNWYPPNMDPGMQLPNPTLMEAHCSVSSHIPPLLLVS